MLNIPTTTTPVVNPECRSRAGRPLVSLGAVTGDLDISAQDALALIDDGSLIAFNIAVRTDTRQCPRFLNRSKIHYSETRGQKLTLTWPEIWALISPLEIPNITAIAIQRCLNCDRGHVENLILSQAWQMVKGPRPGPGGSPLLVRTSFEAWLKGRML